MFRYKNKKPCGKFDFVSKLSEIQINHYDSCGNKKYKVSLETLNTIAQKNNWINELDEYNVVEEQSEIKSPIDFGVDLTKSKKNKSKVKVEEPKQKELTDEELELELSLLTK